MAEVLNRADIQFDAVLDITLQSSTAQTPGDLVQTAGSPLPLSPEQTAELLLSLERDHIEIARAAQEEIIRAFGTGTSVRISLAFRAGSILVAGTALLLFAGKVVTEAALSEIVKTAIQRALEQWFKGAGATNILKQPVIIGLNFKHFKTFTNWVSTAGQSTWRGSYGAALIMLAPVVSILAFILTTGITYSELAYDKASRSMTTVRPVPNFPLVFGVGIAVPVAVWLVGAYFYRRRTTFERASQHQRGELEEWRLRFAKQGFTPDAVDDKGEDGGNKHYPATAKEVALQDARAACAAFDKACEAHGILWMTRRGYLTLQDYRHKAEEACIEFEPETAVVMDAVDAHLRLIGSTIDTRETLARYLKTALLMLGDCVNAYLACMDPFFLPRSNAQPSINGSGTGQPAANAQAGSQAGGQAGANTAGSPSAGTAQAGPSVAAPVAAPGQQRNNDCPDDVQQVQARAIIREVVYSINRYRSARFASLISARNQLLAAAVLVGATTYLLLAFAILWLPPKTVQLWQNELLSTMILYLVGAGAGLFYRLYDESNADRAVDDLGLSLARLVTAPLFSGLAAVAGVVFYNIVVNFPAGQTPTGVSPAEFFDIAKHPIDVLVAAFFGLTPNLLINYLQQQTTKYIGELKSTEQSSTDGAGVLQ